jgi:hypothetical protein
MAISIQGQALLFANLAVTNVQHVPQIQQTAKLVLELHQPVVHRQVAHVLLNIMRTDHLQIVSLVITDVKLVKMELHVLLATQQINGL